MGEVLRRWRSGFFDLLAEKNNEPIRIFDFRSKDWVEDHSLKDRSEDRDRLLLADFVPFLSVPPRAYAPKPAPAPHPLRWFVPSGRARPWYMSGFEFEQYEHRHFRKDDKTLSSSFWPGTAGSLFFVKKATDDRDLRI